MGSEETFSIKATYASEQCLRGYMWWAVDMIDESFSVPILSPTFSPAPTMTSIPTYVPTIASAPSTEKPTPIDPTCPSDHTGWLAYLECTHYFYCQNGVVLGVPYACPDGTLYNESLQNCDWEENVQCSASPVLPPTKAPTPNPVTSAPFTTSPTPKPITPGDPACPSGHTGWLAYLECTHYFYCQNGAVLGVPYACADGTLYDESLQNCNWEQNVQCSTSPVLPPTKAPTPNP